MNEHVWGVWCVWNRYFDVYRKNIVYGLLTTFAEPLLYTIAFGYGLGALIPKIETGGLHLTYRQFILSGIVTQTLLFQAFFDGAYGSFIRMYYQKIFNAMACTPITLSEVLWGEIFWDSSKATFSATVVLLLGVVLGDFNLVGALCSVPLCFIGAVTFSSLGLLVSALSRNIEQINYPQYLVIFPMFLFCGVFFPLEQLPSVFRVIAWGLPLTSQLSLTRTLTLGTPLQPWAFVFLFGWVTILVVVSRRSMQRRLVK